MRLAKHLLGGTSGLLRLLARTSSLTFGRWDLVWVPWLAVNCSHLQYYAYGLAPDNASGDGPAKEYVGLAPASGLDQEP